MVPFFQQADFTLYQGDVLTVLPHLPSASVDAVLTDPPYSSGAATLTGKQAAPSVKYQNTSVQRTYPAMLGDARDQYSFIQWAVLWLAECWRIAKDGASVMVFTDWRQVACVVDAVQMAGWAYRGLLVWHKPSARPMLGAFRRDAEFIVYGCKGRYRAHSKTCYPGVLTHAINARDKHHVVGKPLPLMQDLLGVTPSGGMVLDPFIGSGTTALAARATGRACVGVELSSEYAVCTVERLQDACQSRS